MKYIMPLVIAIFLTLPCSFAESPPQLDLGQITVNDVASATGTLENMLKMGGPKIYRVTWINDSMSTTLLSVCEERASETLSSSKSFFRLHTYQEDGSQASLYCVDQADLVMGSNEEFSKFLASNKGKSYTELKIKLNHYEAEKKYPYPQNMGFKGIYTVSDEPIAGDAFIRTISRNTSFDRPSEKTYTVNHASAFRSAMKDALQHFYAKVTLETPNLDEKIYNVGQFYKDFQRDTPEVEFTRGIRWVTTDNFYRQLKNGKWVVTHKYTFTLIFNYPDTQLHNLEKMKKSQARVDEIVKKVILPGMSDVDKIKALHNELITHTVYDKATLHFNLPSEDPYLISGPLVDGSAVCSGYAWAMQALLNKVGISNQVISGEAISSPGAQPEAHAWNLVKLNNQYYHLDTTWDDSDGQDNDFHYGYFLVDDTHLLRDHQWDQKQYPACRDNSLEYYQQADLVANTQSRFIQLLERQLVLGENHLRFRSENYNSSWLDTSYKELVQKYHTSWKHIHSKTKNWGTVYDLSIAED